MTTSAEVTHAELVEQRVRTALLDQLFAASVQSVAGGIAFSVLVAWVAMGYGDPLWAWGWCGAKTLIGLYRMQQARRFAQDPARHERYDLWLRGYVLWIVLDVLTWALILPLFLPGASRAAELLLICGIIAIASVGVLTLSSHFRIAMMFCGACLGPTGLWFALRETPTAADIGLSIGVVIYFVVLAIEGKRVNARLLEMLRLRFENSDLAADLSVSLRAAEASSEAKSRFLAMVSHEMRTPLNGVLGIAQLLRAKAPGPDRALDTLDHSGQLLSRIIGDLLDFSRMESGRIELNARPTDITRELENIIEVLRPAAEKAGLNLALHGVEGIEPWVSVDQARVAQVVYNLIGNALKFTASGGVSVHLAQTPERCEVRVVDTGVGLSEEAQALVFEAFERVADGGMTAGTGLGLTISRRLAQAMGGDVTCTSVLGEGSTFCFSFLAPAAKPLSA